MPIDCEDQELLEGFLQETAELLEKLDDDLVALEKATDDTELMNRIFRSIHTVKGASSFLGFDLLVRVTHKTEDVLNRLRKGELLVTPEIMDVLLEATDLVKTLVADIKNGEIVEREIDETINKLNPLLTATVTNFQESAELSEAGNQSAAPYNETVQSGTVGEDSGSDQPSQEQQPLPSPPPPAVNRPAPEAPKKAALPRAGEKGGEELSDNTTVRVDVKRLDDLMNQVGELVLERNRMIQLNQDLQGGYPTEWHLVKSSPNLPSG